MGKAVLAYDKSLLMAAVSNTYDDSSFIGGEACEASADFYQGLSMNRSRYYSKEELLEMLSKASSGTIPTMPEFPDKLVLSQSAYVYVPHILEQQQYPLSVPVEGFTHVCSKCRPHYEIYYCMDYPKKQITFALADRMQTFPVKEHTDWCWKPSRDGILCQTIDKLDKDFQDPFWNEIGVKIGRKMLRFPCTLSALLKAAQKNH